MLCAQTRVQMHSRANGTVNVLTGLELLSVYEQATMSRAKREVRFVLCHSLVIDSTFSLCSNVATRPYKITYLIFIPARPNFYEVMYYLKPTCTVRHGGVVARIINSQTCVPLALLTIFTSPCYAHEQKAQGLHAYHYYYYNALSGHCQ